jgi:hypothetical protein
MVVASEPLALLRQTIGDTNPSGRWLDSTLLGYIDRGNKRIVRDLKFPDSRIVFQSAPGEQEYALIDDLGNPINVLVPQRVYVAGQIAVPTTIAALEGRQIRVYDQGAGGAGLAPSPGSGGPIGTAGPYAPAWVAQSPLSYPVGNSWGRTAPDAQPWFTGQRPRFYLRSHVLGLVSAPASPVVDISFDAVILPATIMNAESQLTTPDNFMDAIVYAAAVYAMQGTEGKSAEAREYETWYQTRMREQRATLKGYYEADAPGGPKPLTSRSRFAWSQKARRTGARW